MIIDLIRILVLLAVTFVYAMLDLFNNRDLPDWFAYASVVVGLLLAFSYGYNTILESLVIAIAIGSLGYVSYRAGYIGLGDVFEFVFISLVIPLQPAPYLINLAQNGLPFAFSVVIAAGYMAGLIMPVYYIRKARGKEGLPLHLRRRRNRMLMGALVAAMYVVLLGIIIFMGQLKAASVILVSLVAVPAFVILFYGDTIARGMVELVYPKQLVDGDMIAVEMMNRGELAYFKSRAAGFGILADSALISKIKNIKRKIPVYKNAIPLALFIFGGIVVSLLFGNILLLMVFSMLGG